MTVAVSALMKGTTHSGVALSLRANTPQFTPPQPGSPTWTAENVSWSAGTWSGGTGHAGTLSSSAFTVDESIPHRLRRCSRVTGGRVDLTWSLDLSDRNVRAGVHTGQLRWRIETFNP